MKQYVSVITLGVEDMPRARRFYCEGLGWKASSQSNEHVTFFQVGGNVLGLFGRAALAEDAGLPPAPKGAPSTALAHNVGSREEVDALIETARTAGARITKEPAETFWGGYSGYFADPDGHLWEVAHNPFWELGGDGSMKLPE
ncbi:MAG: VOC family protein [Chrysiogenetes bacterium]|nr:VOC family protein [Chrysiogenetes bacterium]